MCRRVLALVIVTGLMWFSRLAASEPSALELGGLRKVRTSIAVVADDYRIEVRMLPVTTFDKATNARLNRDKARTFALVALAKHLGGGKDMGLLISGTE